MKKLKYQSREEAINDHKQRYRSQGDAKGKFAPKAPDKYRIQKITDQIAEGTMVLDVGCNDGGLGRLLQPRGCIVYGVDVVEELAYLAMLKGVLSQVAPAEKLPFNSNMFDYVIMAEVMEHLHDPHDAMAEIQRVIKSDGVFLGSVPHDEGTLGYGKTADYHNYIFNKDELFEILMKYFKYVTITETPYNEEFCEENNIPTDKPNWYNWVCKEKL